MVLHATPKLVKNRVSNPAASPQTEYLTRQPHHKGEDVNAIQEKINLDVHIFQSNVSSVPSQQLIIEFIFHHILYRFRNAITIRKENHYSIYRLICPVFVKGFLCCTRLVCPPYAVPIVNNRTE